MCAGLFKTISDIWYMARAFGRMKDHFDADLGIDKFRVDIPALAFALHPRFA
jgi:hypothetical protein